ncbi:MAG: hypothetical protein MJE77_17235 [Proteobacteria bacterium]|nr:hypothetical protein [Pseudomonadota bacterium]
MRVQVQLSFVPGELKALDAIIKRYEIESRSKLVREALCRLFGVQDLSDLEALVRRIEEDRSILDFRESPTR